MLLDRSVPKVWTEMWTHSDQQCQTDQFNFNTSTASGRYPDLMSSVNDVSQKEWYFAIGILVTLPICVGGKLSIFISHGDSM